MNARRIADALVLSAALAAVPAAALAADDGLPVPHHLAVAAGTDSAPVLLAARRYAAFWNTGDERYAKMALSPDFMDCTLPPGRPQGPAGPIAASAGFRGAVPDLRMDIEDAVIAGDRISLRLRFRGHFTGHAGRVAGAGQEIDFIAFDLYRVAVGVIMENWHLEDNLTLQQQLGLIPR